MSLMDQDDTPDRSEPEALPAWDAEAYAANTAHHRRLDDWFLEGTPLRSGIDIIDLGCGSGDFTRRLAGMVSPGIVVGVDPSVELLETARRIAGPNQEFVTGMAQHLDELVGTRRFDGVVSRAALHWVPCFDHDRVVRNLWSVLRPGGWVRIEMGGKGNVARVAELANRISAEMGGPTDPWCFPDPSEVLERFERVGLDPTGGWVRSIDQRRAFDREELLGWLESQVLNAYQAGLPELARSEFRHRVVASLDELCNRDGSYDQIFVRIDALAWRPDSGHRPGRE
jgi:trans-aconitate methyltransferase